MSTAYIDRRSHDDASRVTNPCFASPSTRRVSPLGDSRSRLARSHIRSRWSGSSDRCTRTAVLTLGDAVRADERLLLLGLQLEDQLDEAAPRPLLLVAQPRRGPGIPGFHGRIVPREYSW